MPLLYAAAILVYRVFIRVAAIAGHAKAKMWLNGRKNIFDVIRQSFQPGEKRVWFHCASLGEFEQGRPVIERFRTQFPEFKIVLTFFSPSGYEVRKNYPGADYVFYLPVDTRKNAMRFISLIRPEKVFFVKYEYWFYYFDELKRRNIPIYLVSAIFRSNQRFFAWYGRFFKKMLSSVTYFFVQDKLSASLLKSIGFDNYSVTGDTRFDRVITVAGNSKSNQVMEKFGSGRKLLIAGSTWEKDEQILLSVFSELRAPDFSIVIAPHEVSEKRIRTLMESLSGYEAIRYSNAALENISDVEILVIDNMGMLSSLYQYGSFAYVGGGFGKGIHNILEAAVFGQPVLFGPNYHKFLEAQELVERGGAFSIRSADEMKSILMNLLSDRHSLNTASAAAKDYVTARQGATAKIFDFLLKQ